MTEFEYGGDELDLFSRATNWKRYWADEIAPFVGDQVLDVGAGIGTTLKALNFKPYRKWVGLEPDGRLCERIARDRATGLIPAYLDLRRGTLADLRSDETFDTILYMDVLEHVEDHRAELARAATHLSKGGHVIIVVPAHNYLYSPFDEKVGHFRRYDKKILLSVIPEELEVTKMRYLDSVGMIASLANRLLLRSDSPTVLQIRLWDSLMVRLSRVADPLLGYQVGKSLVCVLKKSG